MPELSMEAIEKTLDGLVKATQKARSLAGVLRANVHTEVEVVPWGQMLDWSEERLSAHFEALKNPARWDVLQFAFTLAEAPEGELAFTIQGLHQACEAFTSRATEVDQVRRAFEAWREQLREQERQQILQRFAARETPEQRQVNDQLRSAGAYISVQNGAVPRVNR